MRGEMTRDGQMIQQEAPNEAELDWEVGLQPGERRRGISQPGERRRGIERIAVDHWVLPQLNHSLSNSLRWEPRRHDSSFHSSKGEPTGGIRRAAPASVSEASGPSARHLSKDEPIMEGAGGECDAERRK